MMNNAVIGSGAQQSDHSILSVHICHLPANIPWVKAFFFFFKTYAPCYGSICGQEDHSV